MRYAEVGKSKFVLEMKFGFVDENKIGYIKKY